MGCSLYWAEGTKKKNKVSLANTDGALVKVFYDFLDLYFPSKKHKIKIDFCFHGCDENASEEEGVRYWASLLSVPVDSVRAFPNKDKRPKTGKKKNRHRFGMCILTLDDTSVAQHIYGALEEYGNVVLVK